MKQKIELLAPGGDVDSIKAAIVAGANAVYCGLNKFNARNRAANISFNDLQGILRLAHKNSCEVFLTLNIIIVESEIPDLIRLLNKLVNTRIDGIIIQDLGLFYLLSNYFKSIKIHASTQLTTHNKGQISFLKKLNVSRVNLSRELSIYEIKALTAIAAKNHILTEVFVHGSYCISFSGICYMSSVHGGKSGNRGRCSQPCRDRYITTAEGKNYPLNLKDNSAYFDIPELVEAGVASLKIEGRIKEFEYVYTVVNTWKKQLHNFYIHNSLISDNGDLFKVFNRAFSNSFLKGDIHKDMFIDNPMSNSTIHLSKINNYSTDEKRLKGQLNLYEEKAKIRETIKNKIEKLNIAKVPVVLTISGECGTPLTIEATTPDHSFVALSKINLSDKGIESISEKMILKRLKAIDDTEYYINQTNFTIQDTLYLPFKELTAIKKQILFLLNGSIKMIAPTVIPQLKKQNPIKTGPTLSVLISSINDARLCGKFSANIYFQLPNNISYKYCEFIDLFTKNKQLIPWFPSVLIGEDYEAAIEFLQKIHPNRIVTNNTGIAYEAFKKRISWIAGPYLNIVNSYSLLALKENFNCSGAFISNEINKNQVQSIKKPDNFELFYSIYHPIVLMTSRQCLFHQVTGCNKNKIDNSCISNCNKSASITNLKDTSFIIEKTEGDYHCIYNNTNYLNTEIVADLSNTFSSFFIDLRDIKTETKTKLDKSGIIALFEGLLNKIPESEIKLNQNIYPSTNSQYKKGI